MTVQRDYGVKCKNPGCNNGIVLGEYMARRQSKKDPIPFIRFAARKLTCPNCHKTYQYDHSDLRELSTKLSV
jgi:hypothetical protein